MSRKWAWLAAAGIAVGLAALFGGSALWRAGAALGEMRGRVDAESVLRVSIRPLAPSIPAGLQSIGAPSSFTDAAEFQGHLFLAGPAGLAEYDANGALTARYRVGLELPPAPLTALAVGLAGDSRAPELWIATGGEGVVAFDGRGFRQIRPENAALRKLTALLPLSTGRILLGTEKSGVLVWDGHELKVFHSTLAGFPVTALAGDDSSLWIGTLDRGLLHWRAGSVDTVAGLPDPRVLSVALPVADEDTIYAGTALGVSEIRAGKIARTLAPGYFAQSLLAANGKLWVGTLEEGMFEVPIEAGSSQAPSRHPGRAPACNDCSIRKIFASGGEIYALADDSLWHGGQAVLGREAAASGDNPVLKDRNIAALAMDASGRLWIGYFDRGLQILPASGGGRGTEFEDDHLFCVNRIVHDAARGVSAVATANGLVLFDTAGMHQRLIGSAEGLIANQVTDVALRADGSLVAATPAGLSFIDASGISSIYAFQGLVNNHVYALASDGARTLAGTLGGLSVLDGEVVKASYTTANSALKHNWITSIVRVNQEWFVGTYGAGVLRLDAAGRWEPFEDLRGTLEINTNAMAVSPSAVYAGTLDRGLAVYNRASGRWNFFLSGLPSANVTAIEARGGMVYIGTDNGLVKIPETTVVNP